MRVLEGGTESARRAFLFDPETINDVYVVPNFISEGYFTQTVIPRELKLNGELPNARTDRCGVMPNRSGIIR